MALRPNPPATPSKQANTRDAAQQDGFLREVDEALREQELTDLARRYGKPVGGAIIAVLVALAGYLWWDHAQTEAAAERSERAVVALDRLAGGASGADAAARDLEPLTREGSPASRANAAMIRAAILQEQGKADAAATAFAAIAADAGAPDALRDLATLREVAIRFDKLPPQQVIDRLKPLAVPGNPWFGSAGELVGMAYLKQGKPDLAGPLFAAIGKDESVPTTLASRMRQLAGQIGYDSGQAPALAPR